MNTNIATETGTKKGDSALDKKMQMAQADLDDLRKVIRMKHAPNEDRALAGQKRALPYFQNGNLETFEILGSTMIGAILAAVGSEYFKCSFGKWRNQADTWTDKEDWFWTELPQYVTAEKSVGALLKALFEKVNNGMKKKQRIIWSEAFRIAYCLIKDDSACQKCLVPKKIIKKTEEIKMSEEQQAPKKSTTLMLREAEKALALSSKVSIADAGKALAQLPISSRALTIAAAYIDQLDGVSPGEVDHVSEKLGRRLEKVLEETGKDQTEVLKTMIECGDIDALLAMIRGNAGEYSSTADHLTAELCLEIFRTDADMNSGRREDRLVSIAHTLLVETTLEKTTQINDFFLSFDGQNYLAEILQLANRGDEDAQQICIVAKDRGINVPETKVEEEDELSSQFEQEEDNWTDEYDEDDDDDDLDDDDDDDDDDFDELRG